MSLLFIEKLGQAAALLEKQASARWRSVQGLLKMLGPGAHGKNRLDMLNVAAQKLGQSEVAAWRTADQQNVTGRTVA
jgi:hypothetical protein